MRLLFSLVIRLVRSLSFPVFSRSLFSVLCFFPLFSFSFLLFYFPYLPLFFCFGLALVPGDAGEVVDASSDVVMQ